MDKTFKEAITLLTNIKNGSEELLNNLEETNEKIDNQELGLLHGQEMFQEEKDNLEETTRAEAERILNKFDDIEESTLEAIEKDVEEVTTDRLAELQLLKEVPTTAEELKTYADKYSKTPLALRMIEKIAKDQKIMFALPESRAEKVEAQFKRIRRMLNTYRTFRANTDGTVHVTRRMTLELEKETLEEMRINTPLPLH